MKRTVSERTLFLLNYWIIVISITVLKLPIAFGYRDDFSILFLGIIPLLSGVIFNLMHLSARKNGIRLSKSGVAAFTAFVLLWSIALIRTVFNDFTFASIYILGNFLAWLILVLFVILAFINAQDDQRHLLTKAMVYSVGFYIGANLLFYILGIIPPDTLYLAHYPSQMLSFLGISSFRVLFPMASSINGFGTLAGLGVSGLFFLFKTVKHWGEKIIVGMLLISCVIVILLTDARGALIFSIFSIVLVCLPKQFFKWLRWTPFLLSLLLPLVFLLLPNTLGEKFDFLDRPQTVWEKQEDPTLENQCDLITGGSSGFLTNRTIIWQFAIEELSEIKWIHLPGYGFRGQAIAGLTDKYSCLFSSYENREFTTAHQVWLQTIIDLGYLGFVAMLLAFIWIVHKLSLEKVQNSKRVEVSLLAMVLYIFLAGTLESTIYPDAFEIFCMISFILIAMIFPTRSADKADNMFSGTNT